MLFLLGLLCKQTLSSRYYTEPTSTTSGLSDCHLNNKNELKNHISSLLSGYSNANIVVRQAQFLNINRAYVKLDSFNISVSDNEEFVRTFSLTTIFLRSIVNKDGSYDVRHYKVVTSRQQITSLISDQKFFTMLYLRKIGIPLKHPEKLKFTHFFDERYIGANIDMAGRSFNKASKGEIEDIYANLNVISNKFKAPIRDSFKL